MRGFRRTALVFLWGALVLAACGPRPTNPKKSAAVVEISTNEDGTRTFARKINGLLEGRTIVRRATGQIEDILYFHRDSAEGVQRRFYSNGRPATWQQMHRGYPHGESYGFLENGALASIEHFAVGQRLGRSLLFYVKPRNQVYQYTDFVLGDGHEWKARYVEYDTLGQVVARYGFPEVWAERDTVALGDSLTLYLRERFPKHSLMKVVIGNYDAQFHLHDSASLKSLQGRGHAATLRLPTTRCGQQIVRGYLEDSQQKEIRRADGSASVQGQRLYFAHPYFVQ